MNAMQALGALTAILGGAAIGMISAALTSLYFVRRKIRHDRRERDVRGHGHIAA